MNEINYDWGLTEEDYERLPKELYNKFKDILLTFANLTRDVEVAKLDLDGAEAKMDIVIDKLTNEEAWGFIDWSTWYSLLNWGTIESFEAVNCAGYVAGYFRKGKPLGG